MAELDVAPRRSSHDTELNKFEEELSQVEHVALDRVVWKKIDMRILPECFCFFLFIAMDKTNIANARATGLQKSLAMSDQQYAAVFIVGAIAFIASQFPSTLLSKHVGPNRIIPTIVTLWGIISVLQGIVTNYSGLLACRIFLGFLEGGLPPCVVLYLSVFYPRRMLQVRVTQLFAVLAFLNALSGFIGTAFQKLNGKAGRPTWAWVFILQGIFAFLFGLKAYVLFPRSPDKARFLTEKQQFHVVSTLKHTGTISEDDSKDNFSWTEVTRAAKSPHVLILAIASFLNGTIFTGLSRLEPVIVAGLQYTAIRTQLAGVYLFVTTMAMSLISGIISDRYRCRGYTAIFFSLLQVIGFVMFYASESSHIFYASLFFSVVGTFCVTPTTITWLANNSAPHARRATALAISFTMFELGDILASFLLGPITLVPDYSSAAITLVAMSICSVVLSAINLVYLKQKNRLKAERRQTMRKEEEKQDLGDRSAWFVYNL